MVVVLSGEAVASHASFVYQPKPADPEEVELAASAKSFLWRKHKPWACMPVRQSKLFTLDEQTANWAIFFSTAHPSYPSLPKGHERFLWTFQRYFCNVSMRACTTSKVRHASNYRWWSIILRSGGKAGGTRSHPADHARVFHAESDRTGAHTLRVAGMATAKRRPEKPGGLLVPSGIARSRVASLAVTATQEAASPSGSVGPTQRSAASAYGLDRRLLSRSPAIAHQRQ